MCEFYRRYVLVYVAAHVTALLALDEEEDIAIREGYVESLDKEISDFKSFVKRKTDSIINMWEDKNLYKQNCLMSATKVGSSSDKITWSFITGSYGWGPCIWEMYKRDAPNPQGICNSFDERIDNTKWKIKQKARSFWQSYQDKLFSGTSIYSRVQKMAKNRNINNKLLDEIMKEIKDGDKKATIHGLTAPIGTDKAAENGDTESAELGNLANMHEKENKAVVEKLKYENNINDEDDKDALSNSSTNNEKSKDREMKSSASNDNIDETRDEKPKEATDNSINEEEQKFIGSLDSTANEKESLVSNDSSHASSIFEDDDNNVQKQDNAGKEISEK